MYKDLSNFYDEFINVPYIEWAKFIHSSIQTLKPNSKTILDLACGTGTLTELLANYGYNMIGIDSSEEMLMFAQDKASDKNILFLKQDIRKFKLHSPVDVITCTCDALNYILKDDELIKIFNLVNNYLNPNGIFIFDLKKEEFFENLEHKTFFESEHTHGSINSGLVTWESNYDKETSINEYFLNIFRELKNGLYERTEEYHVQKVHKNLKPPAKGLVSLLEQANIKVLQTYNGYCEKDIEREVYVCQVF
ncbi:MAG: class I SAM-dependent methyltransferase [Defluviitaleaceae bacterium]|nr:class I SAM-dependent methyltransferase [Defluviitaleaceae bacterium]